MNIESLKYFHQIVKEGSISNVAKEVHISQSALSQQIQKLESDISKQLLIRSNKGVALTNTGKIVYKFADNIIRTYDNMMQELKEAEKGNIVIKIEACTSIADYALPCTLIKANGIYPNHNYELSTNNSNEIVTNVANNICDIGFSCDSELRLDNSEIVTTKVGVNTIILVAKNDDTFPDVLTVDSLLDSCLIIFTKKNDITTMLINNLIKLGYTQDSLNCKLRVEGIESAKMLILKNYGIAFLPYMSVKEELYKKQLKIISVPEFDMNINITMMHKKNYSSHVGDFLAWFKTHGAKSFC